jgi:hypothetical protein
MAVSNSIPSTSKDFILSPPCTPTLSVPTKPYPLDMGFVPLRLKLPGCKTNHSPPYKLWRIPSTFPIHFMPDYLQNYSFYNKISNEMHGIKLE